MKESKTLEKISVMAEFQEKMKAANPTGLPGLMSPRYPDDKFHKRVVFPTDKTTRRDI